METESRLEITRSWLEGRGVTTGQAQSFCLKDEEVLEMSGGDGCLTR